VGVVQKQIVEYFHITDGQFGLLYSVYSFPNIILPFFGGFVLDYIGLPVGTMITCSLVTIGAFIVAMAPHMDSFWLMLVGRFIFGVGAETSYVAQNTICCTWFKEGKFLSFAMGITVSAGRLGSYFTFAANARAVDHYGTFTAALWLGAFFACLSAAGGLLYMILHYSAIRITKGTSIQLDMVASQPDIQLSQAFSFKAVFWVAVAVCCIYYSAIFPFQSTAVNLLEETHGYTPVQAANLISLLPLTSFFMSPLFGLLIDRVAMRVYFATAGLMIMVPSFILLLIDGWPPYISIVLIGLVFSLVPAALWPCIPLLVEERYIGTSFGLISGIMNACLTLFYWAQGNLKEKSHEVLLFAGLGLIGFIFSIVWNIMDYRMGGTCNSRKPKVAIVAVDSDA
jgi:MFS family permease